MMILMDRVGERAAGRQVSSREREEGPFSHVAWLLPYLCFLSSFFLSPVRGFIQSSQLVLCTEAFEDV